MAERKPKVMGSEVPPEDIKPLLASSFRELDILVHEFDRGHEQTAGTIATICLRILDQINSLDKYQRIFYPYLEYELDKKEENVSWHQCIPYRYELLPDNTALVEFRIHPLAHLISSMSIKDIKDGPMGWIPRKRWLNHIVFVAHDPKSGDMIKLSRRKALRLLRNAQGAHFDRIIADDFRYANEPSNRGHALSRIKFVSDSMTISFGEVKETRILRSPLQVIARNTAAALQLLSRSDQMINQIGFDFREIPIYFSSRSESAIIHYTAPFVHEEKMKEVFDTIPAKLSKQKIILCWNENYPNPIGLDFNKLVFRKFHKS